MLQIHRIGAALHLLVEGRTAHQRLRAHAASVRSGRGDARQDAAPARTPRAASAQQP